MWYTVKNAESEDGLDDAEGFGGAFDAVASEFVEWQAFAVELAKAGFVFEKRAVGNMRAALHQLFYGALKPNGGASGLLEQFRVRRLRYGAAAERDDGRLAGFGGFSENAFQLFVFDLPESGLAKLRENGRDSQIGARNDTLVEIDVNPADLAGEETSHSRLSTTHESGQREKTVTRASGRGGSGGRSIFGNRGQCVSHACGC